MCVMDGYRKEEDVEGCLRCGAGCGGLLAQITDGYQHEEAIGSCTQILCTMVKDMRGAVWLILGGVAPVLDTGSGSWSFSDTIWHGWCRYTYSLLLHATVTSGVFTCKHTAYV